jgi:hypothetical protein
MRTRRAVDPELVGSISRKAHMRLGVTHASRGQVLHYDIAMRNAPDNR